MEDRREGVDGGSGDDDNNVDEILFDEKKSEIKGGKLKKRSG